MPQLSFLGNDHPFTTRLKDADLVCRLEGSLLGNAWEVHSSMQTMTDVWIAVDHHGEAHLRQHSKAWPFSFVSGRLRCLEEECQPVGQRHPGICVVSEFIDGVVYIFVLFDRSCRGVVCSLFVDPW
jgi:hypothetical protein